VLRGFGPCLTEQQSKTVLAAYGITVAQERLAASAIEAQSLVREMRGPLVMKISSPDIAHKTEAGGVRLNVAPAEAPVVFEEIVASANRYGVLVQEMAPPGIEMMLGVSRDPVFGPIVVAALGGIHVEVLGDVAYRVAPIGRDEARRMLDELRGRKLLDGVRGALPSDTDALCDAIVRLSWLAVDLADQIEEIDINPLRVYASGAGVLALDGLIVRP
jgi:acetyltransferase